MKWVKAIAGIAIAVGVVVGFKFYRKFQMASDVRYKLLAACAENTQCVASVNTHFDSCFDANYDWGSRRRLGNLDGPEFAACINEKADESFTLQPE